MGGAQPLAVTMADGVIICIEVDLIELKKEFRLNILTHIPNLLMKQ